MICFLLTGFKDKHNFLLWWVKKLPKMAVFVRLGKHIEKGRFIEWAVKCLRRFATIVDDKL